MSHGFALEESLEKAERVPPAGPLRWLYHAVHGLNALCLGLAMLAVVAAALILCSSVALRYWLKIPTDWQDEMSVFLLVGVVFSCSAYVQSHRGNIGIEALAALLPPALNRFRLFLCDVLSALFCAFFSWKSWTLLHEAWVEGITTSSSWAPPLWIPYGLMAFGMSLLTVQICLQACSFFYPATRKPAPAQSAATEQTS